MISLVIFSQNALAEGNEGDSCWFKPNNTQGSWPAYYAEEGKRLWKCADEKRRTSERPGNNCTVSCDKYCEGFGEDCTKARYISGRHKGKKVACAYDTGRNEGPDFVVPKDNCELECTCIADPK